MVYIVIYTPYKGEPKDDVIEKIKLYSSWIQLNGNTYLVDTGDDSHRSGEIKDDLSPLCNNGDCLFVGYVTSNAAWDGYDVNIFQWLKAHDCTQKEKGAAVYNKAERLLISQMYAQTNESKKMETRVNDMFVTFASNWSERNEVEFDCNGVDKNVLLEFISCLYKYITKKTFVRYLRYVKFPMVLQKDLFDKLDNITREKGWDTLTNDEFKNLFI